MIISIWYNQYKSRKNLLAALKEIENDRYDFELYDDHFSIKTIIFEEEKTEENEDDEPVEISPTLLYFNKDSLDAVENKELFIIFYKKQMIYTVPKRCMTENDIKEFHNIFSEKLGDDRNNFV